MTVSGPTMLGLVAILGYILGRQWSWSSSWKSDRSRQEIARAMAVAHELEVIMKRLRKAVAAHQPQIGKFSASLSRLESNGEIGWPDLCDRADEILKPTLRLGTEISHAYAELLQQMSHLSTFAELRTDPLTGVANRRAFDESLASFLKQQHRYDAPLSLAMLDIDFFKAINDQRGHLQGDRVLVDLAQLLRENVRSCDVLARYGGEEFVILMPQTELRAACNSAERIRAAVAAKLPVTVSIGLAGSIDDDETTALLARADAALYLAKQSGRNGVFLHEGTAGRIVGIKFATDKLAPQPAETAPSETVEPDSNDGPLPLCETATCT